MKITSPAFKKAEEIPDKYTCEGDDINPPLKIEDIPDEAKFLALIIDDPDAPGGTWTHWTVWNIEPGSEIEEDSVPGTEGENDFGKLNYGGPCPPSGTHRYFFKVYALKQKIGLEEGAPRGDLEAAIEDNKIESAQLMGKYKKKR